MTQFADIPWYIIEEYLDKISSFSTPDEYDQYSSDGGFLMSNDNKIITVNTDPMKLFAKNEESDYKDVRANVIKTWEGENVIRFRRLLSREITPSDEVKRKVTEDSYSQTTYKYVSDEDEYQYDIEEGDKIYTRKDSLFRRWIRDNWDRFEDYINIQKPFLYIGEGYTKDNYLEVYYYGLKDWVKDALPLNNRTEKLDEFLDIVFDRLYFKLYDKQRNIFSLLDAFEIESDLIDNLIEFYGTELLSLNIEEFKKRIFIDNLIVWLKQQGAYSSLFVIWNILSRNTGNELQIYDRWHEPIESGSPYPYFEDYDYTNYYNDDEYPDEYSLDSKILSTHYKVKFGVNNNPFSDGYVLPESLVKDLYTKWEECRPVTRVSHYHTYLETITDFTGKERALYTHPLYDANVLSATTLFTEASSGAAIYVQTSANDIWTFDHMLDTENVIIDTYDIDLNRIYPKNIEIVHNNRVRIAFDEKILGTVLVLRADYTRIQDTELDTWTINHLLNHKYVIPQFYEGSDVVVVDKVTAIDENNLEAQTESLSGSAQISDINKTYIQSTESDVWEINHNLGYVGVMIDVYDENDEKIIPDSILLKNRDTAIIYFDNPVKGYAGIRSVGNPRVGGDIQGRFNGIWKVVVGNATDTDDWDYNLQNNVKSPLWTFYYDETNFEDTNGGFLFSVDIPKYYEGYITEIAFFDIQDDLSFYLRGNPLYKHNEMILDVEYNISNQNLS